MLWTRSCGVGGFQLGTLHAAARSTRSFGPSIRCVRHQRKGDSPLSLEDDVDKPDGWTMPVSSEYIPELNELMLRIEARFKNGIPLTRLELAAREVYGTIGHVECDNLLQFWDSEYDPLQAIESFRIVEEHEVADALYASRWLRTVVARGIDSEYGSPLTVAQESEYLRQEAIVRSLFIGVPTRLYNLLTHSNPIEKARPNNPRDRSDGPAAS